MKHVALISHPVILDMNDWGHATFWRRTLEEADGIESHVYTWDNWKTMPWASLKSCI